MNSQVKWAVMALSLLGASVANAVPSLQLDIQGGTYDTVDETTITNNPTFSLMALGLQGVVSTSDTYYLSIALLPASVSDTANLGNVTVDGVALNVLGTSEYGTPPIASVDNDLASHGIYDTFYYELSFTFAGDPLIGAYDVADGSSAAGSLYDHVFNIDASALSAGYGLHFDLYTYGPQGQKTKITDFAPFSHDAGYCTDLQSCRTTQVPEPATLSMLGLGLIGLGALRRRQ